MELKTLGRERKDSGLMATGNEEVPTIMTIQDIKTDWTETEFDTNVPGLSPRFGGCERCYNSVHAMSLAAG